jgi:hypothetical protein
MKRIHSRIVKLFAIFAAGAILISLPSHSASAIDLTDQRYAPSQSGLAPNPYDIGSPTLAELWVNPVTGSNSNNGLTSTTPLKTINAAWNKIPATLTTTGYRINLQPGVYPCEPAEPDNCQNIFGSHTGTYAFPIIIRASGGPGTVTVRGGMDISSASYLYLIDLTLAGGGALPTNNSGNNLLHLAGVDHVLLRGLTLAGPNCASDSCNNLQEVLKVNQVQYLFVENSVIGGAWHSSVDYFAVQYGHFINNRVHTAGQWCMYIKGGTSYLRVEGNEFHNCQLGFSAGQSANFAMIRSPWLHYDAYDIKFINNTLHDLPGVGLGVAGGYNVLFAYNTLYRVGISTSIGYPLLDIIRAERGCNATDELPNPLSTCLNFIAQGGWGPNYLTDNIPAIPNRNVYIYNNIIYNPSPSHTQYTHFNISEPLARPSGLKNMPNPIVTDENLQIRGNVIWNGGASMPLGIEGTLACQNSNSTCNEAQLRAENSINTIQPQLANPSGGDFHPTGTWMTGVATYAIPDFAWDMASVPAGNASNIVATDYEGITRAAINPPGAFFTAINLIQANPMSIGVDDGWVLESTENSNKGGSTRNSTATTFRLGDDAARRQYRGILSFNTGADLPDDAVIAKVTLNVRRQGFTGKGNPVTIFQGFMVDIKTGFFGTTTALQSGDFQSSASKSYGPFKPALSGGWYSIDLSNGSAYINKLETINGGLTQIRLRFKLDDNNNGAANYLSLFSGNADVTSQPQLIIEYYAP